MPISFDFSYSDVEEEKTNSKKWKSKKNTEIINPKRKRDEDGEDAEEEEDDDDDGIVAESTGKDGDGVVQKTKRKKKQKKAKGPNNWIYVSGLPVDVTLEEIKDHFSKVCVHGLISPLPLPCILPHMNYFSSFVSLYQCTLNVTYSLLFADGTYRYQRCQPTAQDKDL